MNCTWSRTSPRSGFDSTYEGLKLRHRYVDRRRGRGFDSTYEGLKLLYDRLLPEPGEGFDSTYEGLKRLQVLARLLGV